MGPIIVRQQLVLANSSSFSFDIRMLKTTATLRAGHTVSLCCDGELNAFVFSVIVK